MSWYSIRYVGFCLSLMQFGARASTILQVHDRPEADQEELAGVLSTPQEQRGPQLDLDRDGNPIVTFKAAYNRCQAYAVAPSKAAIDDLVSIQIVYNNRLPNNQKWKKDSQVLHTLAFVRPIEIHYDDAGTNRLHGGAGYQDTNHNWGIRLVKNNKPLTKEADYIKYIRHAYSTAVPYDISYLTLNEAEHLVEYGALDSLFEKQILSPLKEKLEAGESWSGPHEGFKLIMIDTKNGKEPGIDGSLDDYLTDEFRCTDKGLSMEGDWIFLGLRK